MNHTPYTPRHYTHEGCAKSNRGKSGYSGYSIFKGEVSTTLMEGCNNEECGKESQIRIPLKILKESINLVESIRKLINQCDNKPRFYVHKTNKKYYKKHNIKTSTDFSIYILNLCEEYLKKIDTKNTDFIKNKLPSIEKIQKQLYYYERVIKDFNAINDHAIDDYTKNLLSIVSLQIKNLIEIGK